MYTWRSVQMSGPLQTNGPNLYESVSYPREKDVEYATAFRS